MKRTPINLLVFCILAFASSALADFTHSDSAKALANCPDGSSFIGVTVYGKDPDEAKGKAKDEIARSIISIVKSKTSMSNSSNDNNNILEESSSFLSMSEIESNVTLKGFRGIETPKLKNGEYELKGYICRSTAAEPYIMKIRSIGKSISHLNRIILEEKNFQNERMFLDSALKLLNEIDTAKIIIMGIGVKIPQNIINEEDEKMNIRLLNLAIDELSSLVNEFYVKRDSGIRGTILKLMSKIMAVENNIKAIGIKIPQNTSQKYKDTRNKYNGIANDYSEWYYKYNYLGREFRSLAEEFIKLEKHEKKEETYHRAINLYDKEIKTLEDSLNILTGNFPSEQKENKYIIEIIEEEFAKFNETSRKCFYDDKGKCYETKSIGRTIWFVQDLKGTYTFKEAKEACPKGSRLPRDDEWQVLNSFYKKDNSILRPTYNRYWSSSVEYEWVLYDNREFRKIQVKDENPRRVYCVKKD